MGKEIIYANIPCIIFLIFTGWCLNSNHMNFAIIAFICAIYSACVIKTEK